MQIEYPTDLTKFCKKTIEHRFGEHDGFIIVDLDEKRIFTGHLGDTGGKDSQFVFTFNECAMGKCISEWLESHKAQLINLGKLFQVKERNGVPCLFSEKLQVYIDDFAGMKDHYHSVMALQESLTQHVLNSPHVWQAELEAGDYFSGDDFTIKGNKITWGGISCDYTDNEDRWGFCSEIEHFVATENQTLLHGLSAYLFNLTNNNEG